MQFTVLTENLRENILLAEKNVGRKTTLPALSSILFSAEKSKICVTATNLETGIEVWVSGKVDREGKAVVPARVLSSFISSITSEQVHITSHKDNVEISTPTSKTVIHGYAIDDFPVLPKTHASCTAVVSGVLLGEAVSSVAFAAAASDIRPEMSSMLFLFNKKELTLAATDSFRLAERKISLSDIYTDTVQFLLPVKSAVDLIRLLENEEGDVEVFVEQGQVTFLTKRFRMISRLTEGVFPDYEKIVPRVLSTELVASNQLLANALRVAGLFTGKLHDITFHIKPKEHAMDVQTSNSDIGRNESRVEADVKGEAITVSFNYRYIHDGVERLGAGDVFWGFASSAGPLVMKKKGEAGYFYIVMPMKA